MEAGIDFSSPLGSLVQPEAESVTQPLLSFADPVLTGEAAEEAAVWRSAGDAGFDADGDAQIEDADSGRFSLNLA